MAALDPLDEALARHRDRADRAIVARLNDAHAHARLGSIATATQRLADLQYALVGPEGRGILGDAREQFYRDAYRDPFDPDLHDPDRRHPSREEAHKARTAPIKGIDAGRELALLIDQARSGLVLAHATGRPEALATWHGQHSTAIRAWTRRTLSDAQVALHAVVGYHRLKPEYRDET